MNRFLEYGIGAFHLALFLIVAFITFWMGVEKAGYEYVAQQHAKELTMLSEMSFKELGEVKADL